MSYYKWFAKEGWKQYFVPFFLGAIITIALIHQIEFITEAPIFIAIGAVLTILGFDIGIVMHSIMNYKANKDK
jgi:hypothetical protein